MEYISDLVISTSPEKISYSWQSDSEANHVISRLTVENQTVLDPIMGSGTTGIAAIHLCRKLIGIEIDSHAFDMVKCVISQIETNSSLPNS